MLTHRNLVANALHFQVAWRFEPETCWLIVGPAVPPRGLDRRALHGLARRPAGRAAGVRRCRRARPDRARSASPPRSSCRRCWRRSATSSSRGRATCRRCASSATAARRSRPRRFDAPTQAFPGAELMHLYGATETAPIATTLPHEERMLDAPRARSCGQPAVGVEIDVLDRDGTRAADGDGRRGRRPRRQRDGRLLEQARADGRRARRRLVPHAATSATSTTTATSTSSTGPRT